MCVSEWKLLHGKPTQHTPPIVWHCGRQSRTDIDRCCHGLISSGGEMNHISSQMPSQNTAFWIWYEEKGSAYSFWGGKLKPDRLLDSTSGDSLFGQVSTQKILYNTVAQPILLFHEFLLLKTSQGPMRSTSIPSKGSYPKWPKALHHPTRRLPLPPTLPTWWPTFPHKAIFRKY